MAGDAAIAANLIADAEHLGNSPDGDLRPPVTGGNASETKRTYTTKHGTTAHSDPYLGVINVDPDGRSVDAPARGLTTISAADFELMAKPSRRFLVPDLIPDRNVTILSGDGGTGKSLLAMQLAVAVTSGVKWLALPVETGSVLYLSAEDDADECHIRLKDICEGDGLRLPSSLYIAVMAGEDCLLATENTKKARMDKTPLYARLEATIGLHRPRLVVLDNVADIFGGNENIKALVRQFIGMIRHFAITYDCAVLMLAHPSLSGMSSGTGSSGNVAWNNSVRSRLYLKRQHDDPSEITDPDFRKLVSMKANYAPTGGEIGMRWEHGRFVPTETPAAATGSIDRMAIQSRAERVFLALVHQFEADRRNVSPSRSASYAPVVFANHPHSEGVTKRQFEVAMDTLFAASRIKVIEVGPASRKVKTIVVSTGDED
ncbi:MAG: AAA family ATPase [Mesorhizobium sp.]|nr:AAA family ATPase [Mesorhizobium sp.]MBL8576144.1 AAA family ATPase [Mesorhizobium sp.]